MSDKIYAYLAVVLCFIMAGLSFMGMVVTNQYISSFLWVAFAVLLIDGIRTKHRDDE